MGLPSGFERSGSPYCSLALLLVTSGALFAIVAVAPENTAILGFEDRVEEGVTFSIRLPPYRQLDNRRPELTHIDGVLRLFEPDYDPESIKPRRAYAECTLYFRAQ